jgi:hypothetical protein
MNERVESEFKKWQERYDIPYDEEYNVKLLLQIRDEIDSTPMEHVKTKRDLNDMADRIYYHLRLKPREPEEPEREYDYTLLIIGNNNQIHNVYQILRLIIDDKCIKNVKNGMYTLGQYYFTIELYNGVKIIGKSKTEELIQGYLVDYYLNLTGDQQFEEEVLKPMLKSTRN